MTNITHSDRLTQCLVTGQPVTKILDFGQHAYADTFVAENQLHLSEPVFPLQLHMNPESGSIQLGYVSDAEDRYNLYSYSYTSSNSKTARDHWDEYANTVQERYPRGGLVVEIGSNDGYLIKQFNSDFVKTLAVDPSDDMCQLASAAGVEPYRALFSNDTAKAILTQYGRASIIMANNVFNHSNNPLAFAQGVESLLTDDGVFVFELPSWAEMVKSGRFVDMVYHEHISYFTVKSSYNLLRAAGLEIIDYDVVNYHGGSLRVVAKRATGGAMSPKVAEAIEQETLMGLFDLEFYTGFQKQLEQQRNKWLLNFYQILQNDPDAVIIGVGAAAKANTWLTWHKLDGTMLDCITDASPHKQGKYTPLSRIPIRDDNEFARHPAPYALVLSWNIGEPLRQALLSINPNTRFISQ